jgi:hypothetical protein
MFDYSTLIPMMIICDSAGNEGGDCGGAASDVNGRT